MSVAGVAPVLDRTQAWRVVSGHVPGCPPGTVVTLAIRGNMFEVTRPWAGIAASLDSRSANATLGNDGRDCVISSPDGEVVFTKHDTSAVPQPRYPTSPAGPQSLPSELVMPNPSGYLEGSWNSSGYRSGRMRALWTEGIFVVTALAFISQVVLAVQGVGMAGRAVAGNVPAAAEVTAFVEASRISTDAIGLCFIALAIAYLAWISRTVEIVPTLGGGTPKDSPRMSIGWWFVPIAFLWKPYTVVREVLDRLSVPAKPPGGLVVEAWWFCLLGGFIVDHVASAITPGPGAWSTFQTALWLTVVGSLLYLGAAIFGFLVVRDIQARADLRSKALGFDVRPGAYAFDPGAYRSAAWLGTPTGSTPQVPAPAYQPAPAPVAAATPMPEPSPTGVALRHLNELREQGLVTEDEYTAKRAEILSRI